MPERPGGVASDPTTILVVCTGNICRSPMAAGFIEHHLRLAGLTDRAVQSRGTHALEGHRAVKESVAGAAARGVDISRHRALPFTLSDVDWADVILVMEHYHVETIGQQFGPRARDKSLVNARIQLIFRQVRVSGKNPQLARVDRELPARHFRDVGVGYAPPVAFEVAI